MIVRLCGVRGSTPAPGLEFAGVGGHTSCLALAPGVDADAAPTLLLDAGTGIRRVTALLDGRPFVGTILLTHLHWDHVHGLPFFAAGDRPDAVVTLGLPVDGPDVDPIAVLARGMSPPHFPIGPLGLRGAWRFVGVEPGSVEVGAAGFTVEAVEIPHKGGRTFGYRVSDGSATIAYAPDHGPSRLGPGADGLGALHPAALALASGADVLFHDAQHTAEELPSRAHFGHSAADYAVELGATAGAHAVVLLHHDPSRDDAGVRALAAQFADAPIPVSAGIEGHLLVLS